MPSELVCGTGYCDRTAVAYVLRTLGPSRRVIVVFGVRADQLGEREPVELRCIDCVHAEIDTAAGIPTPPPASILHGAEPNPDAPAPRLFVGPCTHLPSWHDFEGCNRPFCMCNCSYGKLGIRDCGPHNAG